MDIAKISHNIIAAAAAGALVVSVYNAIKINEVHVIVNSRLSELLVITKEAANAEGRLQGRALEKEGK